MLRLIREGAVLGLLATLTMDLLTALTYRLGLIAPLPPGLIGRWFAAVAHAHPIHADIAQVPMLPYELAIAVPVHYAIGVSLACSYLWLTTALGLPQRIPAIALGFALGTSLLPWLLMFPAMGYGFFGAHGPAGTRLFVSSLCSHAFYGAGLWLALRFVAPVA
jgi:hypothetical protein